jgi:hypothetical protein
LPTFFIPFSRDFLFISSSVFLPTIVSTDF